MIALGLSVLFGVTFGYGLVGPIAVTYSAKAYFPLVTFVVFLIGFMVVVAIVAQGVLTGSEIVPIAALQPPLGFWLAYSVSIAAGVSLRVARRLANTP